ncbi:hypothetical protein [Georgenia subflava]|uniref:hypothetical protein n=1 Tax=Georgenia subflava TaxID=1622177 RepID=UPI00186B3565|nr:hypothetical protein [Georgenia subflava]
MRIMRAAVALLLLSVAAMVMWPSRPAAPALTMNVAPVAALPAAPAAWTGDDTGCVVPDPTGTGGCVAGSTAWMIDQLRSGFGELPTTCWSEHAWNPASDHPAGLGCDFFFGATGEFPTGAELSLGWTVAEWLRVHAADLRVSYVIWQGRIWTHDRAVEGWRPYTGGGVYDAQDATGGHYDHIHVSLRG